MGSEDLITMSIQVTVLGTAQDGGYPQVGCFRPCCEVPRADHSLVRFPVALGIIDEDGNQHLIEASRTMGDQFELWHSNGLKRGNLVSLSITHAHLGHIDGLGLFGREVMAVNELSLNCSESLHGVIKSTPNWNLLLENQVLIPRIWQEKTPFSPINLEQLSLFDSDNILVNGISGFSYLKILPKKVISAIKKSL